MSKHFPSLCTLFVLEEGATMHEYALMVVLIAAACLTGVSILGTTLLDLFNQMAAGV